MSRWNSPLAAAAGILAVFSWLVVISDPARHITPMGSSLVEPGISIQLASDRARTIHAVRYDLLFEIPVNMNEPVRGRETIRFVLQEVPDTVVLDFAQSRAHLISVQVGAQSSRFITSNGHLIIQSSQLQVGENEIAIEFIAGEESLNRNPEYLYTLFVPARAHLAFPCFDQPDLKARYSLTLGIPAGWEAVANGAELERQQRGDRTSIRFAETPPLPTYLFAFVAGKFQIDRAERDGRAFRLFHRETDKAKVARNRDALFDLHAAALSWMEDYTTLPYMFGKFDFVLIPSFQFSGMEHAGAILYNASSLFLDETATQEQQLARASTISHETAHMWFGDLVTMQWFDDVWMKEVFANFFAAKIVNPSFPELNHDLRFLMAHYPAAYEVDRTAGANPIRQPLDNLRDAGSLYGAIIYQKAPIVMRQLEELIGEAVLREGLREYLTRYAFGNATWPALIRLLDDRTAEDLATWSRTWVQEPGRPDIRVQMNGYSGHLSTLGFAQSDPRNRDLIWNQRLHVVLGYRDGERIVPVKLNASTAMVPQAEGLRVPDFVLPNGQGRGYGLFELDPVSRRALIAHLPELRDPLTRGSAWVTLWDELLEQRIGPAEFMELGLRALSTESNELNVQRVLGYLGSAYWRLLRPETRARLAPRFERVLRDALMTATTKSLKATYFSTLRNVALTSETVAFLERVWRRQESVPGLTLSETDESALALDLAVREVGESNQILLEQIMRIQNPDRRDRFAFLIPALSADARTRDRFFSSLAEVDNRRHEPWVLDAVAYLHHPLRAHESERYLHASLLMLEEIQRTGDIFFPKRWLDAALASRNSPTAATVVREFLGTRPKYPPRLRQIILQSADPLFRAAAIVGNQAR